MLKNFDNFSIQNLSEVIIIRSYNLSEVVIGNMYCLFSILGHVAVYQVQQALKIVWIPQLMSQYWCLYQWTVVGPTRLSHRICH